MVLTIRATGRRIIGKIFKLYLKFIEHLYNFAVEIRLVGTEAERDFTGTPPQASGT